MHVRRLLDFTGRVALVTGAGSGLGGAVALAGSPATLAFTNATGGDVPIEAVLCIRSSRVVIGLTGS